MEALTATQQAFVGRYLGRRSRRVHIVQIERVLRGNLVRGRREFVGRLPAGSSPSRAVPPVGGRFLGLTDARGRLAWVGVRAVATPRGQVAKLPFERAPLRMRDLDAKADELATPALLTLDQVVGFFAKKGLRWRLRGHLFFRSPRDGRRRRSAITLRFDVAMKRAGGRWLTHGRALGLPHHRGLPAQPPSIWMGVTKTAHFVAVYRNARPRPLMIGAVCTGRVAKRPSRAGANTDPELKGAPVLEARFFVMSPRLITRGDFLRYLRDARLSGVASRFAIRCCGSSRSRRQGKGKASLRLWSLTLYQRLEEQGVLRSPAGRTIRVHDDNDDDDVVVHAPRDGVTLRVGRRPTLRPLSATLDDHDYLLVPKLPVRIVQAGPPKRVLACRLSYRGSIMLRRSRPHTRSGRSKGTRR
ncbi:MAG: hypothetical protein CSA65_07005 [Proteobacteria bacterium]|nr:MAG: hypothetical protein CSB49_05350 [Pseudomonadota bacterium]PIE17897.1 MAG: hypothetical protein CSA65_07005 [Pseudomonadota bacterium]